MTPKSYHQRKLQCRLEELYSRFERPFFPGLDLWIAHITSDCKSVTATFPMESLISRLVLPISQQLVGLCLCLRRKRPIKVARVNQDIRFASTRNQTFKVGWNLKTRGVCDCPRSELSLDGQLEDGFCSKAIARRSDGGDTLFFECIEHRPNGRQSFLVRVLGEPGLKIELDTIVRSPLIV